MTYLQWHTLAAEYRAQAKHRMRCGHLTLAKSMYMRAQWADQRAGDAFWGQLSL